MRDPSIWGPSSPDALEGLRVVSGTGELLGRAVGVELDARGAPKRLRFLEPSGHERIVPLRYVREVAGGEVRLAGPREGYHITRVGLEEPGHVGRLPQEPGLLRGPEPAHLVPPGAERLGAPGGEP